MAKYESPRYKELGFYVDGNYRKFSGGFYQTDYAAEIAVLDALVDTIRLEDEVKPEEVTPHLTTEDDAPKAPRQRKSSANSSAK